MKKTNVYISLAFSIIFIFSTTITVFAGGQVGTKAGSIPSSGGGSSFEGFKTYVDTSSWYWTPGTTKIPVHHNPYRPGVPGHAGYWTLAPGGHYVSVHGSMDITVYENYVFTNSHKKANGSPADLSYKVRLNSARIDDGGKAAKTSIINPLVFFTVNRYQNKGKYKPIHVKNTISMKGTKGLLTGSFQSLYAGDSHSVFGANFTATCVVKLLIATKTKGKNIIVYDKISITVGIAYIMPVNGFNSVNYTGNSKRQTNLYFLRSPSLSAGVPRKLTF